MAPRDFELDYSSDENTLEHTKTFPAVDQPIISNPSPFNTDDSSSESCGPYTCDTESQSELSTSSTPGTPSTSLGTAFSFVGLSSQTCEEESFVTPKPKRKKHDGKSRYNYKKGHIPYKRRIVDTPKGEHYSTKVKRTSNPLYGDIRFPSCRKSYDVKLCLEGREFMTNAPNSLATVLNKQ